MSEARGAEKKTREEMYEENCWRGLRCGSRAKEKTKLQYFWRAVKFWLSHTVCALAISIGECVCVCLCALRDTACVCAPYLFYMQQ